LSGALRIAVVLAVAAAATILANVVLLGVATGRRDPVGRLSPPAAAAAIEAAQPPSIAPAPRRHELEHPDD
jgi:hypothetical protein